MVCALTFRRSGRKMSHKTSHNTSCRDQSVPGGHDGALPAEPARSTQDDGGAVRNPTRRLAQSVHLVGRLREGGGAETATRRPCFPACDLSARGQRATCACVRGAGIRVQTLAIAAEKWGWGPARISEEYGIGEPQVREALAFYETHRQEIEASSGQNRAWKKHMARPRLHLDADTSIRSLHQALLVRGHDVTRTPTIWMPLDASDEDQLLGAPRRDAASSRSMLATFLPWLTGIPGTAASSWPPKAVGRGRLDRCAGSLADRNRCSRVARTGALAESMASHDESMEIMR